MNHNAPESLIQFISRRSRAYLVSDQPLESLLLGRDEAGCNRYSSGEELYQENVIVRCWERMLDWFNTCNTVLRFEEVEVPFEDTPDDTPN